MNDNISSVLVQIEICIALCNTFYVGHSLNECPNNKIMEKMVGSVIDEMAELPS